MGRPGKFRLYGKSLWMDVDGRVHGGRIGRGICSIDGGCTGYVSDSGGPNKIDTTKNGTGGSLLLLVVVSVEPARSANELVART